MRVINYTGVTFNQLTIIRQKVQADKEGRRESYVDARCECGKIVSTKLCNLRTGHTKSCGCENLKRTKVPTGAIVSRLTVLSQEMRHNGKQNVSYSRVKCSCGSPVKWVQTRALKNGTTRSCGCLQRETARTTMKTTKTSHGLSQHPSYGAWKNMNRRCHDESCPEYKNYGARGIEVCERWRKGNPEAFVNFYNDFGQYRKEGFQIDRRDNNKSYSKENCRWVSRTQNARNMNKSRWWFVDGVKYDSMYDAAQKLDKPAQTIKNWCNGFTDSKNGKFYPPKSNCHSEPKYVN